MSAADVATLALAELDRAPAADLAPHVLDVATGTGPAALAAAHAGARAVGLDTEPALLRTAAARARRAGLAAMARFVVGDAAELPFPADSFDAVLSTFGVMFAPDAHRTAAELVRVCRPGGIVAVASWTPTGRWAGSPRPSPGTWTGCRAHHPRPAGANPGTSGRGSHRFP
ncbi:class I SAM-dependent methyltransferase [Streptomyces sp. UG1]|uniref:class I SAM-dependent methyltransferase n=1 Tax=Streptomyces sp. UG1 TaxID=3417652 RepID=UPI003CEE4745